MFGFAISAFFTKSKSAIVAAVLLWYLTAAPFFMLNIETLYNISYDELSDTVKLLFCFLPNTALSSGIFIITRWERMNVGLKRTTFWKSPSVDILSIGNILAIFLGEAILLFLIALYVESIFPSEYGVAKPWYFIFTREYWVKSSEQNERKKNRRKLVDIEDGALNLPIGVNLQNLTKIFGNDEVAVNNLSLNIYENQITVIMGKSGSGKTSTLMMLSGMLEPTSGKAFINWRNIRTDLDLIRKSMGFCAQHNNNNILFDDLTAKEHILFFSHLRGLDKEAAEAEVKKYVPMLNLKEKMNALTSTLSNGMKRKLSTVIALCGQTKVVILDEPTNGMDPATRRAVWEILLAEKKGRTILLTTHFIDEADVFADRIVILADGKLQYVGSPFDLKQRFGTEYHLTFEKNTGCDSNAVTQQLKSFIANPQIESDTTSGLSYVLPAEKIHLFKRMFQELEKNASRLKIRSWSVSSNSLKHVFFNIVSQKTKVIPSKKSLVFMGEANTPTDDQQQFLLRGLPLVISQAVALFKKRYLCWLRTWRSFCCYNLIAVLVMSIAVFQTDISLSTVLPNLPSIDGSLSQYKSPIVIAHNNTNDSVTAKQLYNKYTQSILNSPASLLTSSDGQLDLDALDLAEKYPVEYRFQHIAGCTFHGFKPPEDDTFKQQYNRTKYQPPKEDAFQVMWYNPQALHSAILSADLANNAIIKSQINETFSCNVINKPFKYYPNITSLNPNIEKASIEKYGSTLAVFIGIVIGIVSALHISFYIQEKSIKSKFMQYICGADLTTFWTVSILWDMIISATTILAIILVLALEQHPNWSTFQELSMVFAILLAFHFCIVPIYAISSNLFDDAGMGVFIATFANIAVGKNVLFSYMTKISTKEEELILSS